MINIQEYKKYTGEKNIAMLDNSSIEFLHKIEWIGKDYVKKLLADYDAIFIPNWVLEEVEDSIYRSEFVENLSKELPVYRIDERIYSEFVDGRELQLYEIVKASVANISDMLAYLRRNVEKEDPMDMDSYTEWIDIMYKNWPMKEEVLANGRTKRKNAGEISLTILAEIFAWNYKNINLITIYSQDADTKAFVCKAEKKLEKVFKHIIPISVGFKTNDFLIAQLYNDDVISDEDVLDIRKDSRTVIYSKKCDDLSSVIEKRKLDNEEFLNLIKKNQVEIIF
ncbi:MAG: hypothetical protein IIV51_02205 [Lachnospiraceae bacterium]|nr:hypothetical protein [Lachnospiraceae bacterium]